MLAMRGVVYFIAATFFLMTGYLIETISFGTHRGSDLQDLIAKSAWSIPFIGGLYFFMRSFYFQSRVLHLADLDEREVDLNAKIALLLNHLNPKLSQH